MWLWEWNLPAKYFYVICDYENENENYVLSVFAHRRTYIQMASGITDRKRRGYLQQNIKQEKFQTKVLKNAKRLKLCRPPIKQQYLCSSFIEIFNRLCYTRKNVCTVSLQIRNAPNTWCKQLYHLFFEVPNVF